MKPLSPFLSIERGRGLSCPSAQLFKLFSSMFVCTEFKIRHNCLKGPSISLYPEKGDRGCPCNS